MPRLFVAVEVLDAVRAAVGVAVEPLRAAVPELRWVVPERYHLTLVFIGSVEESAVPAVSSAVVRGCAGVEPFTLELDGRIGMFGRRVVWAGLADSPALAVVAGAVAAAVGEVVPLPDAEREFRAHLTLARAGRQRVSTAPLRGARGPSVAWHVGRVVLMRSAGGYSVVRAVDLADGDT